MEILFSIIGFGWGLSGVIAAYMFGHFWLWRITIWLGPLAFLIFPPKQYSKDEDIKDGKQLNEDVNRPGPIASPNNEQLNQGLNTVSGEYGKKRLLVEEVETLSNVPERDDDDTSSKLTEVAKENLRAAELGDTRRNVESWMVLFQRHRRRTEFRRGI